MNIESLILNTSSRNFNKNFLNRLRIDSLTNVKAQNLVNTILTNIKNKGDVSLLSYINKS